MPSKFDLLREGKSIEFEPGVTGRLNPQTKKLELSTGEVLDASNDPDFFPQNQRSLNVSRHKEHLEKKAKTTGGEFLHQYTSKGIPGGILDWPAYLSQTGEQYAETKQAENEVSNRISKESPYVSAAATGANIATDIALTKGMSAFQAAPVLTLGSAGSRILSEPEEVLTETALTAAGGKFIDKTVKGFQNIANRRAVNRALPAQQQSVRNQNIAGQQAFNEANALEKEQFNVLKQNNKTANETRVRQHENEMAARQHQRNLEVNAYEKAKVERDAEIIRRKNEAQQAKMQNSSNQAKLDAEYKTAKEAAQREDKAFTEKFKADQKRYQEDFDKLPQLQKEAQAEYSANVVKNAAEIEKSFPKDSRISTTELGIKEFIDDSISKSGIAGTKEASQAKRVLNSIFPEGELLGGRELSKRYKALEDSIQRSTPEVQNVLNNFKEHLGQKLPSILEDSIVYSKIVPLLKRTIENDVKSILHEINFAGRGNQEAKNGITKLATSNAKRILNSQLTPADFVKKLQSGELAKDLANQIMTVEDFLIDMSPSQVNSLKKIGTFNSLLEDAERKHSYFVSELADVLQNKLARYEIKAMQSARGASQKIGKDVKKTYGVAEPVPLPNAPEPLQSAVHPTEAPRLPDVPGFDIPPPVPAIGPAPAPMGKPILNPEPVAPAPQTYNPIPEPTLPPPQGLAESAGDLLEKPLLSGGRGIVNNPLSKLAALKYVLGKAALPLEAAYAGLKGITSPTAAGQVARMTFKQGGIQAIDAWAQQYPSYHNGILDNPMERRSLTKQVEDDSEIPIEQKAIIQSKINRGKPLQSKL
jgi:hypothetical protein